MKKRVTFVDEVTKCSIKKISFAVLINCELSFFFFLLENL